MIATPSFQTLCDAFDLVDVPMVLFREHGTKGFQICYVNATYERLVGFTLTEVTGRELSEVFPARLAATANGHLRQCLESGQSHTYEEVLTLDGTETWWQTTMTPAADAEGARLVTGVLTDISRHRARDLSNAQQVARLTALYKDIRDFAGLTAHDMRAPLANVVSITQLVLHDFIDMGDSKREMIEMCGRVAIKSISSIDQIMERVERLDSGPLTSEEIDLYDICRDLAALVDPHGKLTISYPHVRLRTDTIILRLALRNLIDNASRYCESQIEIGVELGDGRTLGDGRIVLTVRDDGPGFDPQAGPDPVAQEAKASAGNTRGFGLRTVANLLSSRGGFLLVDPPTETGGACLRLGLPGEWLDTPRDAG